MSKNTATTLFALCLLLAGCASIYLGLVDPSTGNPLTGGQKTGLLAGGIFFILLSVMFMEDLK